MQNIRFAPLSRLTALGLAISLFGLTLAPLAHAQAAADPKKPEAAKPAEPKPAAPAAPKPAAAPAAPAPKAAAPAAKPADAKPKEPNKKTRDAARKAYGEGEKAFASGDFAAAYAGFEKAHALIPSPHAQYWMAKSLDQQGKTEEAIQAYDRLLADPEAIKIGDDKVADARARLDELKLKLVAQVSLVTVPPSASVTVDGTPEPTQTPLTLKLQPGMHKLSISAPGFETKEIEIDAKAGDKSEQRIELASKPPPAPPPPPPEPVAVEPPPAPPPPPPPEKRSMVPAFVTLGIAAAGAAVGTVFGLQALSAKSDFDDDPSTEAADDTERNALIADMAFGVAITLGVTGIVLLTSGDEAPKESARAVKLPPKLKLELDAHGSRTGGSAAARLRF